MLRFSLTPVCRQFTLVCVICVTTSAAAVAQSGSRNVGAVGGGGGGAAGAVGGGGGASNVDPTGFSSGSSSSAPATSAESIARGQADFIRSLGEGTLHASEAAINFQEANKRSIENKQFGSEAFNEIIQNRTEAVHLVREYRRARLSKSHLERSTTPTYTRLNDRKLDRDSGDIRWPRQLMIPQLADHRRRIELLYAKRNTTNDFLSLDEDIREEVTELASAWKGQIRRTKPNIYIAGKKFIMGLKVETNYLPGEPLMVSHDQEQMSVVQN